MTTINELIHTRLAQISPVLSVNSPWEGPEQDATFCFFPCLLLYVVDAALQHQLKEIFCTYSSNTCWCATMTWHNMTESQQETYWKEIIVSWGKDLSQILLAYSLPKEVYISGALLWAHYPPAFGCLPWAFITFISARDKSTPVLTQVINTSSSVFHKGKTRRRKLKRSAYSQPGSLW